ncbi:MAG: amidohydrolase family protein [Acidobacteriota bacterium]|nr:amidohydrolase family protein [Acidobacteriota bacterium]
MKKYLAWLLVLLLPVQLTARQVGDARPTSLAFTHVTVIDMTGAPPKRDMTLVITGGRITSLGRSGRVRIPPGARVIDAAGKYLIPGLWDMHVHIKETERSLPMFVANGVTGVRNTGGIAEDLFRWRAEVAAGRLTGPRIVACGPVVDGVNPWHPDHSVVVRNAAEGRAAVVSLKRQGADFIKVYDGVPRDAYFAIAAESRRRRIPFVGHVPASVTTAEASDAGQKSIEHLGTILEGSSTAERELRNWVSPPAQAGDFSAIPRRIAARGTRTLDTYSDERARALFGRLVRNHTWQVPTLLVKKVWAYVDDISTAEDERFRYVPQSVREEWSPQRQLLYRYRTPEFIVYNKRLFGKEMELVGAMRRAGVEFMAGTDVGGPYTYYGFSLHDELALFVEAGFTPLEALQAATRNPARFLGESDSQGTVERGKLANLVLLEADPLENIRNTRLVNAVVLNGRYLPKEALQKMLADVEAAARR